MPQRHRVACGAWLAQALATGRAADTVPLSWLGYNIVPAGNVPSTVPEPLDGPDPRNLTWLNIRQDYNP
jgi:hypothetical protein